MRRKKGAKNSGPEIYENQRESYFRKTIENNSLINNANGEKDLAKINHCSIIS